jgi:hypothetical protein
MGEENATGPTVPQLIEEPLITTVSVPDFNNPVINSLLDESAGDVLLAAEFSLLGISFGVAMIYYFTLVISFFKKNQRLLLGIA